MDPFRSITIFFLGALTLIGLLAVGCNPGTEEPDAPATPETAMPSSGAASPEQSAASPSADTPSSGGVAPSRLPTDLPPGVEAAVPDNFPSDLPIYPGSQPAQGRGAELEGVPMSAVQLMTDASASEAYDFYRQELESGGWTIEEAGDVGAGGSIMAAKGSRKVSVLIQPSSDGGADIFVVTEG